MNTRATLEVIAPTIEEAIANGLEELGLPEEAVEVEILDEGSRGLFGIRSRQARVRLTLKQMLPGEETSEEIFVAEERSPEESSADRLDQSPSESTDQIKNAGEPAADAIGEESTDDVTQKKLDELTLHIAEETISELLERMKIKAELSVYYGEVEDARSRVPVCIDIEGQDLSILIGRQAETLNALQYITSLILGKELGRSVPLVVDVEGYRKRREQQLRKLAQKMAEQAIITGRRQILEPMPANERRIVHIELRDHPDVFTESIGEEPRRKVTIQPR